MNSVAGKPAPEFRTATPAELLAVARMQFAVEVLQGRSSSELSGFLWRIKLKVARHMLRVLMRGIEDSHIDRLPALEPEERRRLLQTHPLLQPDLPKCGFADLKSDWKQELTMRIGQFADRLRSRQAGL